VLGKALAEWEERQRAPQPVPEEPQPPAELVAFAERHGVEVRQCARRPYRHKVEVSCVSIFAGDGDETRIYCHHEGHGYVDGATIDEALAKLAAATVDDEEVHLEVVGLIQCQSDACILPDGMLHNTNGEMWWVSFRSSPLQGPAARSPWLAVIALQGEMHEKADEAMRIEKACREWRKSNA
jgi:hypothetical protein